MSILEWKPVSARTWINFRDILLSSPSLTPPAPALIAEQTEDAHDGVNLRLTDVELLLCRARAGLMLGNQTLYEWQDGHAFPDGYGLQWM